MAGRNRYYFISDVHLGVCGCDSRELESRFVSLLGSIRDDAAGVFLLGDIFDFWYEYRYTIPRGHTRALGALAALTDSGVPVWFFPGNHDVGAATLAAELAAAAGGADFIRTHEPRPLRDGLAVLAALKETARIR